MTGRRWQVGVCLLAMVAGWGPARAADTVRHGAWGGYRVTERDRAVCHAVAPLEGGAMRFYVTWKPWYARQRLGVPALHWLDPSRAAPWSGDAGAYLQVDEETFPGQVTREALHWRAPVADGDHRLLLQAMARGQALSAHWPGGAWSVRLEGFAETYAWMADQCHFDAAPVLAETPAVVADGVALCRVTDGRGRTGIGLLPRGGAPCRVVIGESVVASGHYEVATPEREGLVWQRARGRRHPAGTLTLAAWASRAENGGRAACRVVGRETRLVGSARPGEPCQVATRDGPRAYGRYSVLVAPEP